MNNEPSELIEATDKLINKVPSVIPSKMPVLQGGIKPLINKIDELLRLRIKNELRVLKAIDEGFLINGTEDISPAAMAMHKSAKDSISELVKVKMNLEGIATETKSVVHRFDVNGLLEALRSARVGKVGRTDDRM